MGLDGDGMACDVVWVLRSRAEQKFFDRYAVVVYVVLD